MVFFLIEQALYTAEIRVRSATIPGDTPPFARASAGTVPAPTSRKISITEQIPISNKNCKEKGKAGPIYS